MADRKRRHWTDEAVEAELRQLCQALGHFPSNSELRSMGRNDLAVQVSRRRGFVYWSVRVGTPRRESDSDTGWRGEDEAARSLQERGFTVTRRAGVTWPFDLLLEGVLRVDVKATRLHRYGHSLGWFYHIGKQPQSDLILLWQLDTGDFYAIPWYLCPRTNVTISQNGGKYAPFRNNILVIREMIAVRKEEERRMAPGLLDGSS